MNKLNEKERIRINCENYIKNEDYIKKWSSKNNGNKKNNFELKYEIKNILKKRKKILLIIAKNLILIKFISPGINYFQNFIRNKSNEEK